MNGRDVTLTISAACQQKLADVGAEIADLAIPNTEDTPPDPGGIYVYITVLN